MSLIIRLTIVPFTQRADPPRIWIAYAANNRDTSFIDRKGIGLALFFGYRQSDGSPTSGGNRGNGGGAMKPRKTPPTEGLVGIAMHVLFVFFILRRGWRLCRKRQRQMPRSGKTHGRMPEAPTSLPFESSGQRDELPPPPQTPGSPESTSPQHCKRESAETSQARDEWLRTRMKDMPHATIFGSREDFEMLLEVDAAQGLGDTREFRMRQRLLGREIYWQALYGVHTISATELLRTLWRKLQAAGRAILHS
jgi:hypothetical protein